MEEVEWFKADKSDDGIETIGFIDIDEKTRIGRIVGYNGICIGEKVRYKNKKYTVVMASRMGDFGLSKSGELHYDIRVSPKDVELISA